MQNFKKLEALQSILSIYSCSFLFYSRHMLGFAIKSQYPLDNENDRVFSFIQYIQILYVLDAKF